MAESSSSAAAEEDPDLCQNSSSSPLHSMKEWKKFATAFSASKGAILTAIISFSISFAIGCTVAIVPEILSDRFARLRHGYSELESPCASFPNAITPIACRKGADDAQDASAWFSLLQNLITLFLNPIVGRMSDIHGRRHFFALVTFLYTLGPITLVMIQTNPEMNPLYFYLANSVVGVVSFLSLSFAVISDSVPEEYRTPSFGVVLAGFYGGFALSPFLAIPLGHLQVSILSSVLAGASFVYVLLCFPETLPDAVRQRNQQLATEESAGTEGLHWWGKTRHAMARPFREMSILNRDFAIRLVAVGSFFSSMVYAIDHTLVIFYMEAYLDVREKDIAFQFLAMGTVGIIIQAFLLQPMLQGFGEKGLLILSFLSGTVHNLLYGVAKNKGTLYVALSLSQLTKTNTPILASMASKDVTANEQGQIQGALYAVNALSAAIGPLSMQFIYKRTKDSTGPGTMFVFASFLYFIGTIVVSFIPVTKSRENVVVTAPRRGSSCQQDLEEPLLSEASEASH